MTRISTLLYIIAAMHIAFILGNGLFLYHQIRSIESDARFINQAGLIRGLIQRTVKLEINGDRADGTIVSIDGYIKGFLAMEPNKAESIFSERMEELEKTWTELKFALMRYRSDRMPDSKDRILRMSEEAWQVADNAVFWVQSDSERKQARTVYTFAVLVADLVLIGIIFFIVKRTIRGRLEYAAYHDPMTGLLNRSVFLEMMERNLAMFKRYRRPFSLMIIDIDHFKTVNDRYGHKAGDEVLIEMAHLIQSHIRKSDIFCRIGGEEFAIVLPLTTMEQALVLGDRIRETVAEYPFPAVGSLCISGGITSVQEDDHMDGMFNRADRLLYQAKQGGRNRVVGA